MAKFNEIRSDRKPGFATELAGNLGLGWFASTRSISFRTIAGLMLGLGISTPVLFTSFIFFDEGHITRAELVASNLFLWSFLYAFIVLPPVAHRICGWRAPTFNQLTPGSAGSLAAGRLLGMILAYAVVALALLFLGLVLEWLLYSRHFTLFIVLALQQVVLGGILITGTFLFAQIGGVLFTSLAGVVWFLLGTQKAGFLNELGSETYRALCSAGLSWLPDFTLFQVGIFVDAGQRANPMGILSLALYSFLFFCLNTGLAVLVIRRKWRGSRPGRGWPWILGTPRRS